MSLYENIKKTREAILKIKNNNNLKTFLGKNGRKAYDNKYNWSIMEKRLKNLYMEL